MEFSQTCTEICDISCVILQHKTIMARWWKWIDTLYIRWKVHCRIVPCPGCQTNDSTYLHAVLVVRIHAPPQLKSWKGVDSYLYLKKSCFISFSKLKKSSVSSVSFVLLYLFSRGSDFLFEHVVGGFGFGVGLFNQAHAEGSDYQKSSGKHEHIHLTASDKGQYHTS